MGIKIGINSYFGLDEAKQLVEDNFGGWDDTRKTWNTLSDDDKEHVIKQGTKVIDKLLFRGNRVNNRDTGKLLNWPRRIDGLYTECPEDIKLAIIYQGIKDINIKKSEEYKLKSAGVKTYTIKDASITFNNENNSTERYINGVCIDTYSFYLRNWVINCI